MNGIAFMLGTKQHTCPPGQFDATYTDAEYEKHKGWGHSTWAFGVHICKAANVKKLILFHHDPSGHAMCFLDQGLR